MVIYKVVDSEKEMATAIGTVNNDTINGELLHNYKVYWLHHAINAIIGGFNKIISSIIHVILLEYSDDTHPSFSMSAKI